MSTSGVRKVDARSPPFRCVQPWGVGLRQEDSAAQREGLVTCSATPRSSPCSSGWGGGCAG